ncbi:hypothetical protein QZH41_020571 [Actinostola sp. cb2023]|nr:hypothetical protein QZH41_020571 [Actinostola sp. cb2023]
MRKRSEARGGSSGPATGISPEVQALLDAQKDNILSAVHTQIAGLQSTLLEQQANLAQQVAIEAEGDSYTFKKKGNEEQHKFNKKVHKANSKALHALESGNVAKAQDLLKEGIVLLNNRQKLVKLADKSDYGWATIQEYVDDELADNESDAKKIKKAEKRAAHRCKALQEKKRKSIRKSSNQSIQPSSFSPANANHYPSPYNYFRPQSQYGQGFSSTATRVERDLCYRCGRRGHWANSCSSIKPNSTSTK